MKLKRILATLIALAMVASIVPMTFAATPGVDIDFESNDFDGIGVLAARATKAAVTNQYGYAGTSMSLTSPSDKALAGNTAARVYKSGVALTKSGSRLSFKVAAADTNSVKAVSFNASNARPATALFKMDTDGKMYLLDNEICAYDTERWYQIDIEFANSGAYTVYVDGGYTAKQTGTATATMSNIFGSDAADSEERFLIFYMQGKTSGTASTMYVDDFETETTDATSSAAVPATRKLDVTYNGSATFENGMMKNIADGATAESIVADFTVISGVVKVVDNSGNNATGAVAPGMKLVISSQDESTKLEYTLDCLNLVFTVPAGTPRDLEKTISVTFNGTGSVEFWVDGALKATDTEAPYEYTVVHGDVSKEYDVKAVVITAGDVRTETETETYNFVANSAPTLAFSAATPASGAGVTGSDTVTISVTATDSDYADGPVSGVTKVELYFNGAKVAEETSAASATLTATYTAANLARGQYSYYAKAIDADGAEVVSDTVTFSVIESAVTEKDYADFENGNKGVWGEFQTTNLEDVTDPAVREGTVKGYVNKTEQSLYMKNDTSFFSGVDTLYWEMDIMTSNPATNKTYLQVRGPNAGSGEPQTKISTDMLGIEANKWYKVKYVVNCKTNHETVEVYEYDASGVATLQSVQTFSTATLPLASFASVRIYINEQNGGGSDYKFYMDNIKLYTVEETTYVSGHRYANKQFVLSYNNTVEKYQFDENNFKVTDAEGNEVTDFGVSTVLGDITLTFNGHIESQATYTVEIKNLDSRLENGTAASYTFTTPAKAFDVLKSETTANADGTGATVKFNASTAGPVEVIYAIYSGDKLIGIKKFTPDFNQGLVQNIPAVEWIGTGTDKTAKVFVWSGITGARTIYTDVID